MGSIISRDFIIFWDSSVDPFKTTNIPKWSPYPEVELDFDSGFQVSKNNEYRKRPILITWKELNSFIYVV